MALGAPCSAGGGTAQELVLRLQLTALAGRDQLSGLRGGDAGHEARVDELPVPPGVQHRRRDLQVEVDNLSNRTTGCDQIKGAPAKLGGIALRHDDPLVGSGHTHSCTTTPGSWGYHQRFREPGSDSQRHRDLSRPLQGRRPTRGVSRQPDAQGSAMTSLNRASHDGVGSVR